MFESTLEVQEPRESWKRIGAVSAAAFAHLGVGLAIVAVTSLIVSPARPPEPPVDPFAFITLPPLDPAPKNPIADPKPSKPKGPDRASSRPDLDPPPVVPDTAPTQTPDVLPDASAPTPDDGALGEGDGPLGVGDGSGLGGDSGTGDGWGPGEGDGDGVPVEVTGEMVRPKLLVKVEPEYPQVARRAGLRGRVTLRAVIGQDGGVESVEVLASTNPLFSDAAVGAVRQWRYRPASMGGRPVRVYLSVVVDFVVR